MAVSASALLSTSAFAGNVLNSFDSGSVEQFLSCEGLSFSKGEQIKGSCFFRPEIEDEVVIGFFNNYRPQFQTIQEAAKAAGIGDIAMEEISLLVHEGIESEFLKPNQPVSLVGFGSFSMSQSFVEDRTYDYEFILNTNVAENYTQTGLLETTGLGLPNNLVEYVKAGLDTGGKGLGFNLGVVLEKYILTIIAVELDAGIVASGPIYFYEKANKAAGIVDIKKEHYSIVDIRKEHVTKGSSFPHYLEACKDTNPGSMHLISEVWNQPFKFELNGDDRYFSINVDGADAGKYKACGTFSILDRGEAGDNITVGDELPSGFVLPARYIGETEKNLGVEQRTDYEQ